MPTANQRISEYLLQEKIGSGAFGEVWLARHHVWADQLVAIKLPTDPTFVRHLQREGAALHGLLHPNVVRALGFDPFGDPPYLTMEYVPGSNLRALIRDKKLNPDQSVAVLRQVLSGIGYAHQRGLVHRDLKPENVLIHSRAFTDGYNVEGVVKVADFGLGRAAMDAGKDVAGSIAFSASLLGDAGREIAGTLEYMAPEQRSGGNVDARADLYACGVMLYEMLTGEKPAGTDVPSDVNASSPKSLDEIFKRSYSRLEKRYTSADEFRKALDAAMPSPALSSTALSSGAPIGRIPIAPPPLKVGNNVARPASCPHCHKPVDSTDQFCMHCGVQLVAVVRRCGRCGAYPDSTDRFCMFCGNALTAA